MLITIDFETYYDTSYTLKKMSTSEYIRDPRFEAISCSIKIGKRAPFCYFGHASIQAAFDRIDWSTATLLAHHTHFDGLILSHHFGVVPTRYADTLSMARALHPKNVKNSLSAVASLYGKTNKLTMPDFKGKHLVALTKDERRDIAEYNNTDVQACYEIYVEMLEGFPVPELDLIDITVRMFAHPVMRVDMKLARAELREEQARKAAAIEASGCDIDTLSSNPKFVYALKALGVEVPLKPSPTVRDADGVPTNIPALAKADEALQALRLHNDPRVANLVEGRLAAKSTISESKAVRMIDRGKKHMRLPIYLNYALAHTLRWTGGDRFNPQNFKQSQKVGGKLREAMLAPPGKVLVVVDSSQIEARLVSWLAECAHDLEAYRQKRDLYCEFATKAYERKITKEDKEERFVGKTCKLGLGFNMGGPKLQASLLTQSIAQGLTPVRLGLTICYNLVDTYRSDSPEMPALWKFMNNYGIGAMMSGKELKYKCVVFKKERVALPNGLSLLYPELRGNVVPTAIPKPVPTAASRFEKNKQPLTAKQQDSLGAEKVDTEDVVHNASYASARSRSKIYGGLLTENIVQALARIIVADAMREIALKYRVVMMTHDEIVFVAPILRKYDKSGDMNTPEERRHPALTEALEIMRKPPSWAPDLPLDAEGGWDVCYSK